jgi:MFS family permease
MATPPQHQRYGTFETTAHDADDGFATSGPEAAATAISAGERAALLNHNTHGREKRSQEDDEDMEPFDDHDDSNFDGRSHDSAQAGVKRLEAIASTWSKTGLYLAYLGIALTTWATSLESQTTTNLTVYATSAFSAHSLVSTVLVVQGVVLSVVKPPMSKVADVFGRFEAFGLSLFLYVVGYIQQAAANNVKTYAAAQLFYAAGQTGLQILIQIFIADTSDLLNRALIVTIPDIPFLVNVWIGPALAEAILRNLTWRWGYGMWAVILPISFLPLGVSLYLNQRKAAQRGLLPPSPFEGKNRWQTFKSIWVEMDAFGLLLICVGFSLILIPLTVGTDKGWGDPGFLAMLIAGTVCIIGFPFWETNKKLAPRAFFPRALFRNRTVLAGLAFAFFYFSKFIYA